VIGRRQTSLTIRLGVRGAIAKNGHAIVTCVTEWSRARDVRRPAGDEVQLWRIPLDGYSPACLALLRGDLDDDERARTDAFAFPRLSDRFVVAHAGLRAILGRALGVAAKDVRFCVGPHGKPALATGRAVGFSLSHSGDLAVIALAGGGAVGVDVEKDRPDVSHEPIARRFLSPAEADGLLAVSPAERKAVFFRGWTRREAVVKMLGLGLAEPLDAFDAARVTLVDFEPRPGYFGALAVDSTVPPAITRWEWVP
jgi:4'-phosphopantetheinyl transferase